MKKKTIFLTIGLILAVGSAIAYAAEKAPQEIVDFAHSTLAKYGSDPVIVKAVKAENAKGKTLAQIQELDKKWMATPGITDYMQALMDNECAKLLHKIQQSAPYYAEIFVMDNLGANVAMSDKTSDYWQGDEAKFIKSYNAGRGAIFVDNVKFDDSTQAYLVQVSVPVKDGNNAIGAITFGISVDKFGK
jgi:hypothetical protein